MCSAMPPALLSLTADGSEDDVQPFAAGYDGQDELGGDGMPQTSGVLDMPGDEADEAGEREGGPLYCQVYFHFWAGASSTQLDRKSLRGAACCQQSCLPRATNLQAAAHLQGHASAPSYAAGARLW